MCQAEKGPELTAPAAPEASEQETELLAEAKGAGLFLDRELSWLQFNRRVLEQAGDPTVPLLERLKFLGIYRSNLEEFFMVRVGSLTHRAALLPDERDEKTGCTPGEQVSAILVAVAAQQPREERIYRRLLEDMRDAGMGFHKMTKPEEVVAKKYFSELRPLLSPRVVDGGHPFPFIANREIYVAATIGKGDDFRLGLVSLLRLPPWRVVELDGRQKVMLTAELVRHFVPQLFKKQEVRDAVLLQVTRNADVFIDDDLRDFGVLRKAEKGIRHQPFGRDIDDFIRAAPRVLQRERILARGQGAVEIRRANAVLQQREHLIAHQRNERRDDERDALQHERGNLVTDRLARAGGHDGHHVAPAQNGGHRVLLPGAKIVVAKNLFERRARRIHRCHLCSFFGYVQGHVWGFALRPGRNPVFPHLPLSKLIPGHSMLHWFYIISLPSKKRQVRAENKRPPPGAH